MTLPDCRHCGLRVRGVSVGAPGLCDPVASLLWWGKAPNCRGLVEDEGHPTPCVDCDGLGGGEFGWAGLVWLAALCGVGVDEATEAVTRR